LSSAPQAVTEQKASGMDIAALKPSEVVKVLDSYIVGQNDAKRAVAIALRNRWRRNKLPEAFKNEVIPKNILMIGPTGCGKTEIARRISLLSEAPFVKVEATKFTEVGFHGRDVDHIIRDLVEMAIKLVKKLQSERLRPQAVALAEERLLASMIGTNAAESKQQWLESLRNGELDEREIDVDVPADGDAGPGAVQSDQSNAAAAMLTMMGSGSRATEKKRMKVADARPVVEEMELEKLIDMDDVEKEAIAAVEANGIVFIDEIDKICSSRDFRGMGSADASAEGVQRDLLPLIEGSTINTKYGNVDTDHILFIASGAFHTAKPSDLLAELQGRLPIRVELNGLTETDMYKILTEPVANLIRQQTELMKTEEVELQFEPDALLEIARIATEANRIVENIGARRLHSVIERIMEEISFEASTHEPGTKLLITKDLVQSRAGDFVTSKQDLAKFIL